MKKTILIALIALVSCTKEKSFETYYQNVKIGEQYWMSQNWDAVTYRNGDPIPQITDSLEWVTARHGAWRYYDNNPINWQKYGKLYNWYAVNDPRGLAPQGWHVPNNQEWSTMIINNGLTIGGFTNMPGGYSGHVNNGLGQYGMWWSSNESDSLMASVYYVNTTSSDQYYICKFNGLSVRFVKD